MVIFTGLLSDLFPGTNPARKKDIEFEKVIVETTKVSPTSPESTLTFPSGPTVAQSQPHSPRA